MMRTDKNNDAMDILNTASTYEPENSEIHLMKASIYSQMGAFKNAIYFIEKAIENNPENKEDLYMNLSFEYQNIGDYTNAIASLKSALIINPENNDALYDVAFCFDQAGKLEESIPFYQDFIDKQPYSVSAWFNLGYVQSQLGNHEAALEAFDYVTIIDETFSSGLISKANTLICLEKYQEAIDVFFKSFEYEEPDIYTLHYMGECYEQLMLYNEALEYYQKSLKIDITFADSWIGCGVVLEKLGFGEDGLKCIKKAVDIEPQNIDFQIEYAELLNTMGFLESATEVYNQACVDAPENIDLWLNLSSLYFENNLSQKAVETIFEGIKTNPERIELYYRLAAYFFSDGYEGKAVEFLKIALERQPEKKQDFTDIVSEDLKYEANQLVDKLLFGKA